MRAPDLSASENQRQYSAAIEMAAAADAAGFDACVVSEHHASPDGFLPSPLLMAAAIAARTQTLSISVQALLVPLHDPVRLAEDIAVLDLLSNGRVVITTGLGYRPVEYELFDKEWKRRGRLLDEAIETMIALWAGEPVLRDGREVFVTPRPVTQPHPMLMIGGNGTAAVDRAARFGLSANLSNRDPALRARYFDECARLGVQPGVCIMPPHDLPNCVFVSEDPDRTWAEVGPHMLQDAVTYESWATDDARSVIATDASTIDELRRGNVYRVMTPEECIEFARENRVVMFPLVGGADPSHGWRSLELYIDRVLPAL